MLQATVRTWRSSLRKETIPTCQEENPKAKKKKERKSIRQASKTGRGRFKDANRLWRNERKGIGHKAS